MLLSILGTNVKKFEQLEIRAAKIINGAHYQQEDSMYRSFANMQHMQCADFVFRSLNKTAPEVFHDHFEKVDHLKLQEPKLTTKKLKEPMDKT